MKVWKSRQARHIEAEPGPYRISPKSKKPNRIVSDGKTYEIKSAPAFSPVPAKTKHKIV